MAALLDIVNFFFVIKLDDLCVLRGLWLGGRLRNAGFLEERWVEMVNVRKKRKTTTMAQQNSNGVPTFEPGLGMIVISLDILIGALMVAPPGNLELFEPINFCCCCFLAAPLWAWKFVSNL